MVNPHGMRSTDRGDNGLFRKSGDPAKSDKYRKLSDWTENDPIHRNTSSWATTDRNPRMPPIARREQLSAANGHPLIPWYSRKWQRELTVWAFRPGSGIRSAFPPYRDGAFGIGLRRPARHAARRFRRPVSRALSQTIRPMRCTSHTSTGSARQFVTRYPMVACPVPVPVLRFVDRRPGRRMRLPGRPEDGTCLPGPVRLRPVALAGQDLVIGQSIQSPAILRTATRLSRNRTAPGQDTSSRRPPSPESGSPHRFLSPSPDGAATGRAGLSDKEL